MMASSATGYRVDWSPDDGEWVATARGHPSAVYLAPDPVDALAGLRRMMAGVSTPRPLSGALAGERRTLVRSWLASGYAKRVREAARVTPQDVARDVGCSVYSVCAWEAGRRMPQTGLVEGYYRCLTAMAAAVREVGIDE